MQPTAAAIDPSNVTQFLNTVLDAVQHKHWQALAALLLVGAVALVKLAAPKVHGKFGAFLNSDRGGTLLVLVGGIVGAVASALIAGQKLTLSLIVGGVTTGVLASGGWNVVKKLLFPNDKPVVAEAKALVSKVATLLPFVFFGGLLSSCQCWQPAHQNDVGCVVLKQIIDCTQGAGAGLVPVVTGIIENQIQGQTSVDWADVEARLEAAGIKDGGCILANLENDFIAKATGPQPMGSPLGVPEAVAPKLKAVQDLFAQFKRRHGLVGVRYHIRPGVEL